MPIQVLGYAAHNEKSALVPFKFERRDTRENDVVIQVEYCGVCHSDLHMTRNDWGFTKFPVVPGHEIVGRVVAIGVKVTKYQVGDLVGIGCMVDSCRTCSACQKDLEQYCGEGHTMTYGGTDRVDQCITYGGYSQMIVCNEDFVLKVPENLNTQAVPPILCAGITTWSPLRHWNVGKGSRVAVIGLGGLGHMAIKLANALNAEVTLFTRSVTKEQDAKALGAHHIVLSTDENQMQAASNQFDLIIDTVPYDHDLKPYIPTLALDGTLVLVGYLGDLSANSVPMIMGRRSIAGSVIGGIKETQELLDFCGEHNIVSDVEIIDIQNINVAYERMLKSDVKYRFVIDMQSMAKDA
ncbi:NAD(P)-dependent alcohol dehydrogenase [Acinetobacter ursingii]|uniref:NAD(P)-dependent alcohol dehydrogenase n=1 Tax=Acinetobacter ursingii TaxID=108980 RepID=UPI00124E781F|nr:NAD(P)-dependent alcohol dehydrogenase [Acinetobacter ursingii]MCU4307202.1 NAD(P)-dependent alcohol dehydrogenase [Acinetobacter ursingii]MCU4373144.1 NAD(P)-dependent alcohol dehydrogenase [Acinetobacter ursingii]MDG9993151.1 NAD(P)-dependent alcohol dehydrogenase [Acinetobacter ursingii]MDH0205449.1 NAD(P)-dependent alcohol dehydrogenase [Acinetobacter ursingii]